MQAVSCLTMIMHSGCQSMEIAGSNAVTDQADVLGICMV